MGQHDVVGGGAGSRSGPPELIFRPGEFVDPADDRLNFSGIEHALDLVASQPELLELIGVRNAMLTEHVYDNGA